MEQKPQRPMIPFDELVTPPMLQMLKLFLPYTPASNQRFLGVFVKFLELRETISFFQRPSYNLYARAFSSSAASSPMEMLMDLRPYLPPQQAERMESFLNIMNIMEMVQMFQDSAPSGENAFGDMGGPGNSDNLGSMFSGGFNPMDMVMGMLTPDQQNMFQMYNNMFSNETFSGNENPTEENSNMKNPNEPVFKQEDAKEDSSDKEDANKRGFYMEGDDRNERMDEQSGDAEP